MSMRASRSAALALLAAALLGPAARELGAQEASPVLRAEFRVERDALSPGGGPEALSQAEAAQRLVDEAAWVFAGMVWGYDFMYVPYDRSRGIAERFELRSLGSIEPGDPRLTPFEARGGANELSGWVEYRPDAAGAARLASCARAPWESSQGLGSADLTLGHPGRRKACEEALREAVRALLRYIERNKPRRVSGRVVFERPPRVAIRDGRYIAQARARVEVTEMLPYEVY